MEKRHTQKGITLIALIITIIVLLILAVVAIGAVQNDGIIEYAKNAKTEYQAAQDNEQALLNQYEQYLNNELTTGGSSGENTTVETIPTGTSYVGYYANLDNDEEPEGIIYADLAIGGSGQWSDSDGVYSYSAITGTKDYYVSLESYNGAFGEKPVLTATGTGADRFYVMALEDIKVDTTTTFYWYYNAASSGISDYSTITSLDFGTGKTNTSNMITAWNAKTYGDQNTRDMWGVIQDKVAEGWFVPSRAEWGAFGNNLGITSSNYGNYGLSDFCWSSSLSTAYRAWRALFDDGYMIHSIFDNDGCVRLSATF